MLPQEELPFSSCTAKFALDRLIARVQDPSGDRNADTRAARDELGENYIPTFRDDERDTAEAWCHMFLDAVNNKMRRPNQLTPRLSDALFAYEDGRNVRVIEHVLDMVKTATIDHVVQHYSKRHLEQILVLESPATGRRRILCATIDKYVDELESPHLIDVWIEGIKEQLNNRKWDKELSDLWSSRIVLLNVKNEFGSLAGSLRAGRELGLESSKETVERWMSGKIRDPHHGTYRSLGHAVVVMSRRQAALYDLRKA
ncbi:hypothetical protein JCM11491_002396 [Sporobolomyces phaffii]